MDEPRAMREIHKIRESIYEETKHLTPKEQTEFTRREAQALIEKYNLKVRRPEPAIQQRVI